MSATNVVKLENERKRMGLSRKAFSALIGVRPEYYTRLMGHKHASLALTERMAAALNLDTKDLLV